MRYGRERKEATRQKILEAAGALFRRHGIDGVGVDAIMARAGLTHGGFYAHFPSKEALAAAVCAESLARSAARWAGIAEEAPPRETLRRIVDSYLDPRHAAATESGCVLPALGPDITRRAGPRPALTATMQEMARTLAGCHSGEDVEARGMADLACMVGALVLARLSDDPAFSNAMLEAASRAVLDPGSRQPARKDREPL